VDASHEHLTDIKKYVIIITEYSGIYNIPIIPPFLTSTIFQQRKPGLFKSRAKQGSKGRPPLGGVWGKEAWEASRDHYSPLFQGWGGEEVDF
jgi:hypothetical protein